MTNLPAKPDASMPDSSTIEQVLVSGDLKGLTPLQRSTYYMKVCQSVGLNPFTRPLEYITLNGKLTLYAKRDACDQLRKIQGVTITEMKGAIEGDLYVVRVKGKTADGREDEDMGAAFVGNLKGEALGNAMKKATTQAKRRLTLSICGMGYLDETEVATIATARRPSKEELPEGDCLVDPKTGEILDEAAIPGSDNPPVFEVK